MRASLLLIATVAVCASVVGQSPWLLLASRTPIWHSQAAINDPRSHGAIGDRLLSLAETILLTNKDLDENALSAEEVAQLSGFGGDIAWADVNAGVLPLITLERELPVIRDTPHGFTITGSNGTPTIDLRDTRGFVVRSDFFDAANVRLVGGEHGIHLTQDDTLFGTLLDRVEFEGQGVAGLRLTFATSGRNSRVQLSNCRFTGLPVGIVIDDLGNARSGRLELFDDTRLDGCDIGIDLRLGAGGSLTVYANSLSIGGGRDAMRIRSMTTPRRTLTFEGRYLDLSGSRTALSLEGDPSARSLLLLQSAEFASPGTALDIAPLGSNIDLTIQDSRIHGSTRLLGGAPGRISVDNVEVGVGTLEVGSTAAPVTISSSILEGSSTTTRGTAPARIVGSRLSGGSITGTSNAPISVEDGHHAGTTIGAHVSVLRPLPSAHLGKFDASPTDPRVGSVLALSTSLPPGLTGYVLFGSTIEYALTLPTGLRLYADGSALVMLPSPFTGSAQLPIPIPTAPALIGIDLFFHLAVTPQPGTTAPALSLPPGRRVRIR